MYLNCYKIAGPTVLARINYEELDQLSRGCGYKPYFVERSDPGKLYQIIDKMSDRKIVGKVRQRFLK